jgi:hypothetical protein
MTVTFVECVSGADCFYLPGKSYDVEDSEAQRYLDAGICHAPDQPAKGKKIRTADAPPVKETADAKPVQGA